MTTQEAVKRSEKAQWLKVWQVDDTWFYVESDEGKIAYKCCISDKGDFCNCGDFATKIKNDPNFKCKHLLAVMNSIPRNLVVEAQILEKRKPKLDERFIKQVEGKDFALYAGLLDLAHQKNLISMEVELLQFPTKENEHTAICRATGKTAGGGLFIDVGDANPMNCNSKVAKHIIRMASTRSKARCLRDMTNIGMTCLEELGDIAEAIGAEDEMGKAVAGKRDNVRKFSPKQGAQSTQPVNEKPVNQVKTETASVNPASAVSTQAAPVPPSQESKQVNTTAQESKAVNAAAQTTNPPEKATAKPPVKPAAKAGNGNGKIPLMSEAQKSAIYNLSRRRGISIEELENMAVKTFSMSVENLTHENAVTFIRTLQQAA